MISMIIPFYSDEKKLITSISELKKFPQFDKVSEVLLCHNGSSTISAQIKDRIQGKFKLFSTTNCGVGAGQKLGIQNAKSPYVLLSASDLPFGETDLNSFFSQKWNEKTVYLGSKWAKGSVVEIYGLRRVLASKVFYALRVLILGRKTPRDSQGTIICSAELARELIKDSSFDDFLFSLEFVTRAIQKNITIVELPVMLIHHEQDKSSVSILKHGLKMFFGLVKLAKKI
jgi:GT2 family glycosyltransferase